MGPTYQNVLEGAVVVDGLVGEEAGMSQVMVAVRVTQPERLCNKDVPQRGRR